MGGEKRDRPVDHDSNSDQKPAVNNRYGGPRRDQKGRGDKEGTDGNSSSYLGCNKRYFISTVHWRLIHPAGNAIFGPPTAAFRLFSC